MQNLKFDDGFKSFMINEDPQRVIRFNPTDMSMLTRINEATEAIEAAMRGQEEDFSMNPDGTPESRLKQAGIAVQKLTDMIKGQINYIFNSDVSDAVFGKQSPLSMVGGMPLYARFLESVVPEIEKTLKEEQKKSEKRIKKYTGMIK